MKKFTKIIAGVTAVILSFGIAGCGSKDTNYPAFKPSEGGTTDVETSEKYTVNVRSAGGLKLDGIRVNALNSSGTKVRSGISKDGVINFNLSLGSYSLVVDEETLPAGYYIEEGASYTTNPEKREEVDIAIPSKVISQAATADKIYSLGEIMHDFTLKDYRADDEGYTGTKTYKLSTLLTQKKAVILNFWYPTCTFCIQEFPALQSAYTAAKNNVEVIGVCFAGYTDKNVADFVKKYEDTFNLTFPLCVDTAGIQSRFNVENAPTTIVIDRYGMVAFRESGGQPAVQFWQELFKKYASDEYVQDISGVDNPGGGSGGSSADRELPNVTMPSSTEMAAAASASGLNATYYQDISDEYAWPWTTATDETFGSVVTVTNKGKQNSYATLNVDIELKKDDMLSFDYLVSSEKDRDILYVLLDGQLINGDGWSGTDNKWTSFDAYVADRDKTVQLTLVYQKDEGDPDAESIGLDCAKVTNIRTSKVSDNVDSLDVIREAASGKFSEGKYEHYAKTVLGDDGFYHVGSSDGPLLYISLTNITPWSEQHTINNHFEHDGASDYATLYLMSYYKYAKTIESEDGNSVLSFTVKIGDKDFATALKDYHHMLDMLEKPYQLMPVSVQLKAWAEAFVTEYEKEIGTTAHENEWLEFCFYYDHYGKTHAEGESCLRDTDITQGLTIFNAYEIGFDSIPTKSGDKTAMVEGKVEYPLTKPNGIYYKFTAPKNGVYQIRDYTGSQPDLSIFKMNDDGLSSTNIAFCNGVQDFDEVTGATRYSSFNKYISLSEGETIYLLLVIAEQVTGNFTFDITYHESVDKLMHCSTNGGAWTYDENNVFIYLGINAVYDSTTDRYYHADAKGNPDYSKPVYINMIYTSFFMSELNGMNYSSVETLISKSLFSTISQSAQADMVEYLKTAKANTGDMYGLVEADKKIVDILNTLIDKNGGAGDNRGWMCFGCYMEHITYSAN